MTPLNFSTAAGSSPSSNDSFLTRNRPDSSDLSLLSPQGDHRGLGLSLVRSQSSSQPPASSGQELLSRVGALSIGRSSQSKGEDFCSSLLKSTGSKILTQTTALSADLDHRELTVFSRDHMQQAIAPGGILSMQRQQQEMAKVDRLIQGALKERSAHKKDLLDRIESFKQNVDRAMADIWQSYQSIMQQLRENRADEQSLQNYTVCFRATENIISLLDTAHQISVRSHKSFNYSEDAKLALDLIFQAREKEIVFYSQHIDLIQKVEAHQLQTALQVYEAKLKEQNALFQQFITCQELIHSETQAQAERELRLRAQGHQERMDVKKLELEQKLIEFAHELDLRKDANLHAIEELRLKSQKDIQMRAIQSEEKILSKRLNVEQDLGRRRLDMELNLSLQSMQADERMHSRRLFVDHAGRLAELHVQAGVERDRIEADRSARLREADAQEAVGLAHAAASTCSIM